MIHFSPGLLEKVWEKATIVKGADPERMRKDPCGAWITRNHYSDRDSKFGWVISFTKPLKDGGKVSLSNMRAFQWENSLHRQTGKLICPVKAVGKGNFNIPGFALDQRA